MTAIRNEPTLEQLEQSNQERLHAINARGKTVSGIDTKLVELLLEQILPPDAIARAHRAHAVWLAATLDEIEANLRKRVFTDLNQPGG